MIAIDGLVKRHGQQEVLRGVTLSVGRGEVAAIVGPSGGGKSTLLRCINGLEQFDGGRIAVGDLEMTPGRVPSATLRRVRTRAGMVFQAFHLFPHLSVVE